MRVPEPPAGDENESKIMRKFFTVRSLLAAGLIIAIILGMWAYFKWEPALPQEVKIDKSIFAKATKDESHSPSGGVYMERVKWGAMVNINVISYIDNVPRAKHPEVRDLFFNATRNYKNQEFGTAIQELSRCLELSEDSEKRGALNLQIGNCYYRRQTYLKAAEFYAAGLGESHKVKDLQGEASNLVGIANTYLLRPASSEKERGDNTRKAVEHYSKSLKIFNENRYPVKYATTQNNLGAAYTNLPAATAEERAENVRAAIDCYRSAMRIRRKNGYPQYYCQTAANIGLAMASVDNPNACYWLKEAYAFREYLEDQGKGLEELIRLICKKE